MSEQANGELVEEQPADVARFLPPAVAQDLTAQVADVLVLARAQGLNEQTVAARVVTYVAPLLAGLEVRLEQAGAAMAALVSEFNRQREELVAALVDGERFRALREQSCPRGLHDGWFVASEHPYACPWCGILEARGDVPPEMVLSGPAWPPAQEGVEGEGDEQPTPVAVDGVGAPFECPMPVPTADGALQCPVHGPHPHANLSCPDCATCKVGGAL